MERTKKVVPLLAWLFLCFLIIFFATETPLQAADKITIPPEVQRILDNGPRTSAEIALYQAASLRFRQPLKNGKPKASKCGFSIAADLYSFRNSFTPEEKNFITLALQPRQELQTSIVSPSGIFRIHYDTSGDNA